MKFIRGICNSLNNKKYYYLNISLSRCINRIITIKHHEKPMKYQKKDGLKERTSFLEIRKKKIKKSEAYLERVNPQSQ